MGLILGGASANDLILDGKSVALYVGGNPPIKVWPTAVQITLGTDYEARDALRAALSDRGMDYATVTEIPFDIKLVGSGSARHMFGGCAALTTVPDLGTSGVTNMRAMFDGCAALTSVPDMDTSNVTDMARMFRDCSALTHAPSMDTGRVATMRNMFYNCSALTYVPDLNTSRVVYTHYMFTNCSSLTDGNVRLIGRHSDVFTADMIRNSGLTREPWYNPDGTPWLRVVTIQGDPRWGDWVQGSETGDTDLILEWVDDGSFLSVRFAVDVTCDQEVYLDDSYSSVRPGTVIRAGSAVEPYMSTVYNFTEAL